MSLQSHSDSTNLFSNYREIVHHLDERLARSLQSHRFQLLWPPARSRKKKVKETLSNMYAYESILYSPNPVHFLKFS